MLGGHTADTQSDKGSYVHQHPNGHSMYAAPGRGARTGSSQVNSPECKKYS